MNRFANGVMTMPPTESPVDATDNATDRLAWNQRVTTVVVGTRPHRPYPTAKNAYVMYSCHCDVTWPISASDPPARTAPTAMT